MTLSISVKLNVPESLRRGFTTTPDRDGYITVVVPDDLSQESRTLIANHMDSRFGGGAYPVKHANGYPVTTDEPTLVGVIAAIEAEEAKAVRQQAEAAMRRAERFAANAATIAERRERSQNESVYGGGSSKCQAVWEKRSIPWMDGDFISEADKAELALWQADVERRNEAARAVAQGKADELWTAELARREAAKAEQRAWIEAHGSTRLKRLVKENIAHDAVYRDERMALERPGWWLERNFETTHEPRNPPEEALDGLDEARKSVPEARLVYVHSYRKADEDEEGDDDGDIAVRFYAVKSSFLGYDILMDVSETRDA